MTIITTALALSSALLAPLAPLASGVGHAPTDVSAIATTQAQTAITPTIPSGSTVSTARPQVSGTAPGATRVALVRGRELMGSGVVGAGGRWQVYMLRELTPGVNDMQLLASTPAGTVSSAYPLTLATPGNGVVQTASYSAPTSLGWAGLLTSEAASARPVLDGVATPGATVELRDSVGNSYGQAVVDENWDFRLQVTRDLDLGANQLVLVQRLDGQSDLSPVQVVRTN
ncbi:hypothetical protein LQK89_05880 [Curtobacterium sp. C1]|uniref:Bacterial Ig domain-containing protein n=1 Tax=Curtobacterium citreum TaxID=2036 RepID=A0A850DQM1_9MICO|nr:MULTISPECIES: hypothetical protein [Curtobacterium]MCS5486838.1 hypothetical protein [Curtobacterium flaccumfaciens pv. basellae]NUU26909.1 hypothetical protein [Curtobacterium albidum]UFU15221.1 hypothetical protein LQK89_05880 [Curtobacterium sp. C1]WIJ46490.1 hypothetical protein QPK07_05875 [Curtobacterium citreum]